MERKITYQQYRDLFNLTKKPGWLAPHCHYTIEVEDKWTAVCKARIPMWLFIILFIPAYVYQAVCLIWDGGLCEMSTIDREISRWNISKGGERYEKAKKMWEEG